MICDSSGQMAICRDGCGQLHSPYWSARKSKGLHAMGQPAHRVVVTNDVSRALRLLGAK